MNPDDNTLEQYITEVTVEDSPMIDESEDCIINDDGITIVSDNEDDYINVTNTSQNENLHKITVASFGKVDKMENNLNQRIKFSGIEYNKEAGNENMPVINEILSGNLSKTLTGNEKVKFITLSKLSNSFETENKPTEGNNLSLTTFFSKNNVLNSTSSDTNSSKSTSHIYVTIPSTSSKDKNCENNKSSETILQKVILNVDHNKLKNLEINSNDDDNNGRRKTTNNVFLQNSLISSRPAKSIQSHSGLSQLPNIIRLLPASNSNAKPHDPNESVTGTNSVHSERRIPVLSVIMNNQNAEEHDANNFQHWIPLSNKKTNEHNQNGIKYKKNKLEKNTIKPKKDAYINSTVLIAAAYKHLTKLKTDLVQIALQPQIPPHKTSRCYHGSIYQCKECKTEFIAKETLKRHKNRHSVLFTYTCPDCRMLFRFHNRCELLSHVRSHRTALRTGNLNISIPPVSTMNISNNNNNHNHNKDWGNVANRNIDEMLRSDKEENYNKNLEMARAHKVFGASEQKIISCEEKKQNNANNSSKQTTSSNNRKQENRKQNHSSTSKSNKNVHKISPFEMIATKTNNNNSNNIVTDKPVEKEIPRTNNNNNRELIKYLTTNILAPGKDSNSRKRQSVGELEIFPIIDANECVDVEQNASESNKSKKSDEIQNNVPIEQNLSENRNDDVCMDNNSPNKDEDISTTTTTTNTVEKCRAEKRKNIEEYTINDDDDDDDDNDVSIVEDVIVNGDVVHDQNVLELSSDDGSSEESDYDSTPGKTIQKCAECQLEVSNLVKHYRGNGHPCLNLKCRKCCFLSTTPCAFAAHMRIHSKSEPYICPDCVITFSTLKEFYYHISKGCFYLHKTVRYLCPICKLSRGSINSFAFHLQQTHVKSLFKCDLCSVSSCSVKVIEAHTKRAHRNITATYSSGFNCALCPNMYVTDTSLASHLFKHSFNIKFLKYLYFCPHCRLFTGTRLTYGPHLLRCGPAIINAFATGGTVKVKSTSESYNKKDLVGSEMSNILKTVEDENSQKEDDISQKEDDITIKEDDNISQNEDDNISQNEDDNISQKEDDLECMEVVEKDPLSIEDGEGEKLKEPEISLEVKMCVMCQNNIISSSLSSMFCTKCVKHLDVDEKDVNSGSTTIETRSKRQYKCSLCKTVMKREWPIIRNHFEENHQSDWSNKSLSSSNNGNECIDNFAGNSKKRKTAAKTEVPAKITKTSNEKSKQNGKSKKNDVYVCIKCHYKSKSLDEFRLHIQIHKSPNDYQCLECGECFVVKPSLEKHLIIIHHIKNTKEYFIANNIKKEVIDETLVKLEENQCKVCFLKCESKQSFDKHMRIHGMAFVAMHSRSKDSSALKNPVKAK